MDSPVILLLPGIVTERLNYCNTIRPIPRAGGEFAT
jgi:hypothetical protein